MSNPEPNHLPYLLQPFEGACLKIFRGTQHRDNLSSALSEYARTITLEFGPITERYQKLVTLKPEPPTTFALLLGDCVHNLRSALDITMVDIARLRGRSASDIKFPFADTEKNYEVKINKFINCGKDVVDLLEGLKAYKGGNDRLRALHDLDIDDKHKLVMPVIGAAATIMDPNRIVAEAFCASYGGDFGNYQSFSGGASFTITNGNEVKFFPMYGQNPHKAYFVHNTYVVVPQDGDHLKYYSPYIGEVIAQFPEQHPYLPGRNVLEFLGELIDMTTQIVQLFSTRLA